MFKHIVQKRKKYQAKSIHFLGNLPIKIRFVSLSLFLFMIGRWLGTDTYFSIYVGSIIGTARGITFIGTVLAAAKLLFAIPVGNINDYANVKHLLLLGKILYVFCALLYFFAGIFLSGPLLLCAVLLNGFASATTFTTYRSYYGKNAKKHNETQVFWAYFSSSNIAQIIGALISAGLVYYLELPFMYFFVAIFALISLLQDEKIKAALAHRSHRTRKTFFRRAKHEMLIEKYERGEDEQYFLGRQGFLFTFIRECFSLRPRKRILSLLKSYHAQMYVALGSVCLVNFLNYAGFLFIPIIAIANHLNLSQIAILFAVMKAPYLVNIFLGKRGDKYNKKLIIALILVFMSLFYIMLGINDDFWMILLLTFAISLAISLLNPLTSALVSSYTHQQHKGVMTGAKDFIAEIGEMLGSLGFGAVIALIGIKTGFIVIGIALFALGMYLFMKKLLQHYHSKASLNTST